MCSDRKPIPGEAMISKTQKGTGYDFLAGVDQPRIFSTMAVVEQLSTKLSTRTSPP